MPSPEEKLARQVANAVSSVDFNSERFAYHLSQHSPRTGAVFVRTALTLVEHVANLINKGCEDPQYAQSEWLARILKYIE